jgi:octaprenyl-diphosphate synthase
VINASITAVSNPPLALAQIFEPIREDLERVEVEFGRQVESRVGLIPEIGRYLQHAGGKRVRPAVLLMASRLVGYDGRLAVLFASVVEFIHTATLVHDDIVDRSEFRRGRRAVHSKWGSDVSVLLGDYLYIKGMDLALSRGSLDVLRVLSDVTLRMIEGEIYQLSKNGDVHIAEDEHFDIIRRKTAYLFGGCSQIGGMLGGIDENQQTALREYGFNLGVAFQLVDDLLDLTGTEESLGKPVASDLRDGKLTLPIIRLMNCSDGDASALVEAVVRERSLTPEQWQRMRALLVEHRAFDYAQVKAAEYAGTAKSRLAIFPPSPERDALMALPDYVLSRDR